MLISSFFDFALGYLQILLAADLSLPNRYDLCTTFGKSHQKKEGYDLHVLVLPTRFQDVYFDHCASLILYDYWLHVLVPDFYTPQVPKHVHE